MKRYVRFAAAAAVTIALSAGVAVSLPVRAPLASFAVKIDFPAGHGSGTHIGNGYVLTAAHVVDGGAGIKVLTDTGAAKDAEVLWVNKDYDVALLRIDEFDDIRSVPLSCAPLERGTRYVAYGNPGSVDFVSAAGAVVSKPERRGPWRSVVTVDGTVVPGMSGGGVIVSGRLVGVSVGVMSASVGLLPSITGFGFVVPASDICGLLAR